MEPSKRVSNIPCSPIRALSSVEAETLKKNIKIYHLNIGQPDIPTPEIFFDSIKDFNKDVLSYVASQGNDKLQESFIEYYKQWDIDFEKGELLITNGGSEAIQFALMTTCDIGDEVIIPEPFYTNYYGFAQASGIIVKSFASDRSNNFHLPAKNEITKNISSKTRALFITNPSNPTGVVYTEAEIKMICEIVKEYNLYLIIDEVYREFVYDDCKFVSPLNDESVNENVILIDSISKRYSACGARIGLLASKNKELMKQALKLCQLRLCVPAIEQYAAASLINTPKEYFKTVKDEYQNRRNIIYECLQAIPNVVCEKPAGAFYIIAKLPVDNAEKFARWMLEDFTYKNKTVMIAPAEKFYLTPNLGVDEVRLSYCINSEDLKDSIQIIGLAIKEYNKISKNISYVKL